MHKMFPIANLAARVYCFPKLQRRLLHSQTMRTEIDGTRVRGQNHQHKETDDTR